VLVPTAATIRQRAPAGGETPPTQEELNQEATDLLGADGTLLAKLGGLAYEFGVKGSSFTYGGGTSPVFAVGGCQTDCTVTGQSFIELTGAQASTSAKRKLKLKTQKLSLKAGKMGVLKLKLSKKQKAAIRRAKRAKYVMTVTVQAAGKSATSKKSYRLKLKK
jgi:hypothetical protein